MTAVGPQVHNLPLSAVLEAACNYSACRSSSLSRAVSEREEGKRAGIANVQKQVLHMFVKRSGTKTKTNILENMSHGVNRTEKIIKIKIAT